MKKSLKLVCLFVVMLSLLTGCVNAQFHVTINMDGSADVDYSLLMNTSLLSMSGSKDPLGELKSEYQEKGYNASTISEGDMTGVKLTKHLKDLGELNQEQLVDNVDGANFNKDSFIVKKGFLVNKYTVNTDLDLTSMKSSGEMSEITNAMLSQVKFKFLVTLPIKAKSSNAGNITDNGRTYEWVLIPGAKNPINMELVVPNIKNIVILSSGVIILLAGVIFVTIRKKKRVSDSIISEDGNEESLE